jgi:hypothetical protein
MVAIALCAGSGCSDADRARCDLVLANRPDVCNTSISEVARNPSAYNDKILDVRGYLNLALGDFGLFPTRDDYELMQSRVAIRVRSPADPEIMQSLLEKRGTGVRLVGRFIAVEPPRNLNWLGVITVERVSRIDGFPMDDEPSIDLEDLAEYERTLPRD